MPTVLELDGYNLTLYDLNEIQKNAIRISSQRILFVSPPSYKRYKRFETEFKRCCWVALGSREAPPKEKGLPDGESDGMGSPGALASSYLDTNTSTCALVPKALRAGSAVVCEAVLCLPGRPNTLPPRFYKVLILGAATCMPSALLLYPTALLHHQGTQTQGGTRAHATRRQAAGDMARRTPGRPRPGGARA